MRGVTPRFVSSRAAVSPAGPAPMTIGFRFDSIVALPAATLREASIVGDEIVDVSILELVQRRRQKDELSVLALHRQESAEQRVRSGSDDHVDVPQIEGVVDVRTFSRRAQVGSTQLIARVIGGENVDPETLAADCLFDAGGSLEVCLREQAPIPVQPHAAGTGIETSGDQRVEEVD